MTKTADTKDAQQSFAARALDAVPRWAVGLMGTILGMAITVTVSMQITGLAAPMHSAVDAWSKQFNKSAETISASVRQLDALALRIAALETRTVQIETKTGSTDTRLASIEQRMTAAETLQSATRAEIDALRTQPTPTTPSRPKAPRQSALAPVAVKGWATTVWP